MTKPIIELTLEELYSVVYEKKNYKWLLEDKYPDYKITQDDLNKLDYIIEDRCAFLRKNGASYNTLFPIIEEEMKCLFDPQHPSLSEYSCILNVSNQCNSKNKNWFIKFLEVLKDLISGNKVNTLRG